MAITKERLQELIKQEATIYTNRFKKPEKYKLYKDYFISKEELVACNKSQTAIDCVIKLSKLFETEKDAKWSLKYHATRTEELNLPMWEDVNKIFMGREGDFRIIDKYNIELIYWKFKECLIEVRYKKDGETIEQKIFEPATEENYIKACDLCLKLFKGEEE